MWFSDPRIDPPKEFELHLRTKLPKAISKYQGKYGKTISTTNSLSVRSFGTTSWTDRNTAEYRTKYGPLYIHFQEKCLKNFDTEKFYGSRESFNSNSITVDKDTSDSLKASGKVFLTQRGVKFPQCWNYYSIQCFTILIGKIFASTKICSFFLP